MSIIFETIETLPSEKEILVLLFKQKEKMYKMCIKNSSTFCFMRKLKLRLVFKKRVQIKKMQ